MREILLKSRKIGGVELENALVDKLMIEIQESLRKLRQAFSHEKGKPLLNIRETVVKPKQGKNFAQKEKPRFESQMLEREGIMPQRKRTVLCRCSR